RRGIEQLGTARRRQPSLGRGIDDLELEARLLGDAGTEFFAVLGRAAGRRGNEPRPPHAARAHLVTTDQQRFDRAGDCRLADAARSGNALAETNDAGERVDDAKPVCRRTRDQKPAIIGAEIERGIGSIGMLVHERVRVVAPVAVATLHGHRGRRSAAPPRSSNTFLPRRNSAARRPRPCSSSSRGKCISRRRQGQYGAFPAYEPCCAPSLSRSAKSTMSPRYGILRDWTAMNLHQPAGRQADQLTADKLATEGLAVRNLPSDSRCRA